MTKELLETIEARLVEAVAEPQEEPRGVHYEGLKRISYRHEGILRWLVMNPHRPLSDLCEEMHYTQAWVSCIIHSDLFQVEYKTRCKEAGVLATHSVIGKMQQAANLTMDRLIEMMGPGGRPSERFVTDNAKNLLVSLGYAQPETQVQNHMHVHVDARDLVEARERAAAELASRTVEASRAA